LTKGHYKCYSRIISQIIVFICSRQMPCPFRSFGFLSTNSQAILHQLCIPLFFRSRYRRKPWIPAEKARSLADIFLQKQQKQRAAWKRGFALPRSN
jgi:hypothetical protein